MALNEICVRQEPMGMSWAKLTIDKWQLTNVMATIKIVLNLLINLFSTPHSFHKAFPAARLILMVFAQHNLLIIVCESERKRSKLTCTCANSVNFCNKFRYSQQLGHRAKRFPFKVHIQPGHDHPLATIGQGVAYL